MDNKKLEKNFFKMFWVGAFFNFRLVNLITTLFYLSRGLALSQIFYLAIIFSVSNLLFEIPSSYMADRWGRKKTLILSTSFFSLSFLIFLLSHSFPSFAFAMFVYGLAHALMSGTDEALIYDTSKQLGNGKESLKSLAEYQSSESLFKIFTPILATVLAKDVTEAQFIIVYVINIIFSLPAVFICASLVEPNRFLDLEKKRRGNFERCLENSKNGQKCPPYCFQQNFVFHKFACSFSYSSKSFC